VSYDTKIRLYSFNDEEENADERPKRRAERGRGMAGVDRKSKSFHVDFLRYTRWGTKT